MKYLLILSFFLTSCLTPKYTSTSQFDIRPQIGSQKIPFIMKSLKLDGPYNTKITFRKGNKIEEREFQRWSSSPEKMLSRYWMLLTSTNNATSYRGILRVFEINIDNSSADIVLDYEVGGIWKQAVIREKLTSSDLETAVSGMERAIEKLTLTLSK